MGFSIIVLTLQGINYLIDCYTIYSNSAIAVLTFVRCWFGAGCPLFAGYMFKKLGVAWATSILGFISVAMIPIPVIFFKVSWLMCALLERLLTGDSMERLSVAGVVINLRHSVGSGVI